LAAISKVDKLNLPGGSPDSITFSLELD